MPMREGCQHSQDLLAVKTDTTPSTVEPLVFFLQTTHYTSDYRSDYTSENTVYSVFALGLQ